MPETIVIKFCEDIARRFKCWADSSLPIRELEGPDNEHLIVLRRLKLHHLGLNDNFVVEILCIAKRGKKLVELNRLSECDDFSEMHN